MIGITTETTLIDNQFCGVVYSAVLRKHTLIFESVVGNVCIVFDHEEFSDFMDEVVESYRQQGDNQ